MGWFRSFWAIGFGQGAWRSDWLGFRIGSCGLVLGLGSGGLARLGGGFPPGLLFDNWIGRKRDVGGGVLAGLGCRVGFCRVNGGLAWAIGVRRDTDGHVSKFIALGRQRVGTS